MWVSETPDKAPAKKGATDGLKMVVELNGCCREVAGTVKVQWTAGKSYYIMGRVKEGGGGEYLRVGMQLPTKNTKFMPIPISMFDTSKKGLHCGKPICRHYWFGIGGTKIPNLVNHKNYGTFKPDKTEGIADGNFTVNRDDINRQEEGNNNNMASMIEGYVKAPETGDYIFYTRRSVLCGLHSPTAAPAAVCHRSLLPLVVSAPRPHAHIAPEPCPPFASLVDARNAVTTRRTCGCRRRRTRHRTARARCSA